MHVHVPIGAITHLCAGPLARNHCVQDVDDCLAGGCIQVSGLGFELTMPDIILDVLVEGVDIATVIEVDIGDFTDIKPDVKDVKFRDVGHIDVRMTQEVTDSN